MYWIALPWPTPETYRAPGDEGRDVGWSFRFTPRVMRRDEALLLEISCVRRLWGGETALLPEVLTAYGDALALTTPVPHGTGSTVEVALSLLRLAMRGRSVPPHVPLDLPTDTLTALVPHVDVLAQMGCRTWGDVRRLPRAGLQRRLGAQVLLALDRAFGDAPPAPVWLELPEQPRLGCDLPQVVDAAPALLHYARPLLSSLHDGLLARHQGVLALSLGWRHDVRRINGAEVPSEQWIEVRTAQPLSTLEHVYRLLSERLAQVTLAAPVCWVGLQLLDSAPLQGASHSWLPGPASGTEGAAGDTVQALMERLSARLGAHRVLRPVLQADHRPEHMQAWVPALAAVAKSAVPSAQGQAERAALEPYRPDGALWPTWLVRPPLHLRAQDERPCYRGPLRLVAGPHRLEAGWYPFDDDALNPDPYGAQAAATLALRDYFVAHNAAAGLVWVFRERLGTGVRWFLQGIYA